MALINTTTTGVLGTTLYGDGSGDLTIQQNGVTLNKITSAPAFFAYSATGTTLTAATSVKIILDTKLFDTNNNFNTSTYRFTPTVAGYYQVNCVMTVNFWNATILQCMLFKNGVSYSNGNTAYPQTVGGVRSVVSSLVFMNGTTDYIEMYGFNYAATSSNVVLADPPATNFSASLVRAA